MKLLSVNNKGFTIVEVLISLVIITATVVTVNIAYKIYAGRLKTLHKYEKQYNTVLSIKDHLSIQEFSHKAHYNAEFNQLKYKADVQLIEKKKTLAYDEETHQYTNSGMHELSLFKVDLQVEGQSYTFYKTQYRPLVNQ